MPEVNSLTEILELGNGLEIHFEDRSRLTVAGRCQVVLRVSIPMDVQKVRYPQAAAASPEEIRATLGSHVDYCFEKVRNFIAQEDVPATLQQMKREFLDTHLAYVGKPEFPAQVILKKFTTVSEENRIREAHEEAVRKRDSEDCER